MSDNITSIIGEPVELPQDPSPAPESAAPAPSDTPAEAPTPAPAAEPPAKMVPYQALQEERRLRQQERAQREEWERRTEARLQQLAQQTAPPAPAAPDPNENPVGYLAHQQQTVAQRVDQLMQQSQQDRQQAHVAAMESQLVSRVVQAEAAFKAANPDYEQALSHMHQLRVRELQVLGHDDQSAQQQSAAEMRQAAYFHVANGRNPAEIVYGLAAVRGYSKAPAAAPTPAQQIQMAQKGTAAAAASLGGGGGGASGQLTARALAAMSDEEFAAATKGSGWAKIMGG